MKIMKRILAMSDERFNQDLKLFKDRRKGYGIKIYQGTSLF